MKQKKSIHILIRFSDNIFDAGDAITAHQEVIDQHGALFRVDHLAERLQLAMDNGAKKVLLPAKNKRDFADIPTDVLDRVQIIFYSDPITAAFRAMGIE